MPHNTLQRHLLYLEQDKQNVNLLLTVSDCYLQIADFTSAQRYLDDAKRYTANPQRLVYLEARLLHHLQQTDKAIALLEQSLTHCSTNADAMGLLALLYFDNHDIEKATLTASATLTLDPMHPNGQLVNLLLKSLRQEVSPDEIEYLLKSQPQESRLWFVLGTTQLRLMNCPAAERAFNQTAQIHTQFYDNWICLGWCHLLQNNLDSAETAYEQAIAIDTERADGFGGLGLVYALRNQVTDATHWLSQTEQRDPESFNAKITRMLLANPLDHDTAAKEFYSLFPEVAKKAL